MYSSRVYKRTLTSPLVPMSQGTYKKINLSNNSIHQEGIKAICDVLKPPPRTQFGLEEIDFSNNYAGVDGAIACGELLKSNRTLRKVINSPSSSVCFAEP